MTKPEFLMLAQTFDPSKHDINGWFMSEKMDGMRAFWDGGLTKGIPTRDIPWANCEKDGRFVTEPISSGLWSRYGKPIVAPDWWLERLPRILLDGELIGGSWEETISIVKRNVNVREGEWSKVSYHVFDSPIFTEIFGDRKLWGTWRGKMSEWIIEKGGSDKIKCFYRTPYESIVSYFLEKKEEWEKGGIVRVVDQEQLSFSGLMTKRRFEEKMKEVVAADGEGIVLRCHYSRWEACRSKYLLKSKSFTDSEATIVGWTEGRGKYLGMVGALIVEWRNPHGMLVNFELSGMADEERIIGAFRVGEIVTFRYRKLSDMGMPIEGRYLRRYIP